jgi:hypothetical protein
MTVWFYSEAAFVNYPADQREVRSVWDDGDPSEAHTDYWANPETTGSRGMRASQTALASPSRQAVRVQTFSGMAPTSELAREETRPQTLAPEGTVRPQTSAAISQRED